MASKFQCKHCRKRTKKNPRIKEGQHYCGSEACQQARKNAWEREKINRDGLYRTRLRASKKQWRKQPRGYLYQRKYRVTHPDYVQSNRGKQLKRNQKRKILLTGEQIVKTDALRSEKPIPSGLYTLIPYRTDTFGKIVKTDALIVQLSGIQKNTAQLYSDSM
jgi:hypothetical protein